MKIDFLIKTKWESNITRIKYANTLKKQLQSVSLNDRWKIIQFYVEQFSDVILPANLMMNWGDLQFVKEQGIEIGSLMILDSLPTTTKEEEQLDFALRNSAVTIREKLGNTPSAVSFTTKRNNSRIKNLIHRAGYKLGLAVGQKIYMHGKYGRYALPRIELFNESFLKTKLRINGTISRLRSLIGQ